MRLIECLLLLLLLPLPLFFISFILDVYYGYGTKSMPAFSPFVITFQLKFALIFPVYDIGDADFCRKFYKLFNNKVSVK